MYEKIYQEFITDFLPKIQEGLVITRDYFFDLFGRYVKYLIVVDSIKVLVGLIIIIASLVIAKKCSKYCKENSEDENEIIFIIPIGLLVLGSCFFFLGLVDLIKDIYIPEVRIYQELNRFIINK